MFVRPPSSCWLPRLDSSRVLSIRLASSGWRSFFLAVVASSPVGSVSSAAVPVKVDNVSSSVHSGRAAHSRFLRSAPAGRSVCNSRPSLNRGWRREQRAQIRGYRGRRRSRSGHDQLSAFPGRLVSVRRSFGGAARRSVGSFRGASHSSDLGRRVFSCSAVVNNQHLLRGAILVSARTRSHSRSNQPWKRSSVVQPRSVLLSATLLLLRVLSFGRAHRRGGARRAAAAFDRLERR